MSDDMYTDAGKFPCSVCGKSSCMGHPRHLFTVERIVHVVEVAEILSKIDDERLLRTFAALTHRMHAADREREANLRAQRDIVQAEILRRMS